ncbi:SDR family NAD(P)-dependent oxidoreductase [Moritella sp. Urea-trap-13]|uniref:SDR family NAD(P)-dependent oxidoreductase n=1 Tax=Moritella sp. Urea-trap-13 TaxID=2058327 RepID=UPI000C34AE6F|nr:SDR family NAD(P)-dependent oxidoreductase [Moritella sp. Urea-trap-13]PKH05978.1 short-chain dehydrogenase [Moritella sp. Urea-trap-13]
MIRKQTLIIGANSVIAKAIAAKVPTDSEIGLIVISRDLNAYSEMCDANVKKITVPDYQSRSIERAVIEIKQCNQAPITQVFICNGVLHNAQLQPEKRLEDFSEQAFQQVMQINALIPMLWIQKLTPILTGKTPCTLTVFSARVASISDNHLGGWYSYRASKAALNMMLKTAAIELSRRAKNIKLIAFHPGTTDTPLSKPFQKNVPADKLFTSDFVAEQLLKIVENSDIDGEASYLDWQGKSISW